MTIAICTADRPVDLERCVESLRSELQGPVRPCEILIIDNTPTGTAATMAQRLTERTPVRMRHVIEPRRGLSAARNRAVREARGDLVAFLDDDVQVRPGWAAAIAAAFGETDCAAVAGRVLPDFECEPPAWILHENLVTLGRLDLGGDRRPVTGYEILGCNFAVVRTWCDRVGGFREDLGRVGSSGFAGEETDLALRIGAAGGAIVYCPDATVRHRVRAGELRRTRQLLRAYWGGRTAQRIARDGSAESEAAAREPRPAISRFFARRVAGRTLFAEALHAAWLLGRRAERLLGNG